MSDFVLSCCSPADLSKDYFARRNIHVIFFHFEVDGESMLDDCGESLPPEELFRRMDAGAMTHTSQVSVGEYEEAWRKLLEEGKDILHITLSSGISGSYQSAMIAKGDLEKEFPDRKLYVVDSLGASSGYGLLVDALADLRDAGKSIDEIYEWAEKNKKTVHHWFFSTDLTYFIRGGRVSKGAGLVGQMLNICPLLNVDYLGRLTTREKVRGKKKVILRTLEKMKQCANGGTEYNGKCYISQSACYDDARQLADMIEKEFPKLNGKVEIYPIAATIGCHTGPGTVALFFFGSERED
ncbi:MAG: DegV family protein [Lachnospiraceae bacterium]|nr:DegV family protein [Lachnospiraceae bacterium]MBQ6095590.1 DegV family protein [Lachnospiraceae bacterium]MBR3469589.1 DegV family protein [Lachnospiraceae bacterium]